MMLCTEFSGSEIMSGAKERETERGFEWLGIFEVLNKFYFIKCMKTFYLIQISTTAV